MNFVSTYKQSLSAEIYKYRSTFLFWFLLLAPAFIPAINLIMFLQRGEAIMERGGTAWGNLLQYSTGPATFLFPFFVFVVALFVNNIESSSNTWKLIYTQPVARVTVYLAKLKTFLLMLLASLFFYGLLTYLVGIIVNAVKPDLGFGDPFELYFLFGRTLKFFLGVLGFAMIHFYISQRTKNIILPLGVGIAGIISFTIAIQGWEYAQYHPYGYHTLALGPANGSSDQLWMNMQPLYLSIGLALVIGIIGAIDAHRKRIF